MLILNILPILFYYYLVLEFVVVGTVHLFSIQNIVNLS